MTTLDAALALASRGFHVFPILENGKTPLITDFPTRATTDETMIRKWFSTHDRNIGISTSRFGEDQALAVVDVDDKDDRHGSETLLSLELGGFDLPVTLEQSTPSGGRHLIYVVPAPLKQGVDVLGSGLDIRSRGGYILGPGSSINGKPYAQINGHGHLAPAPDWLVDRLGVDRRDRAPARDPLPGIDADRARQRALLWLDCIPEATAGSRNQDGFRTAAKLKDLGCDPDATFELMSTDWRCNPPLDPEELEAVVASAYRYGQEPQGSSAPEAVFPPLPDGDSPDQGGKHPFHALNDEYAFVKQGAFVLHETTDAKGNYTTQHLSLAEFHAWHANVPFPVGDKTKPISQVWMGWANRRQYEGVVFMPGKNPDGRFFNLWRGYRFEPAEKAGHPALDLFLEHALKNVCGGNRQHFNWLMGYFAHMVQRPWEKPLVALVFRGKKGTGKNALVERVGALLGSHFLVADDDRYLLGNFNSHLEANLFFVLDEAAWAGDKRAEGRLKGLVTGTSHNIERKGREPYAVDNLTRVAIIGNEDWLVPASHDERRFAVFDVGDGRIQDRQFFQDMRVGMEQGGYAHLLRYLMEFDLTSVDVNDAPRTQALLDQKLESLEPFEQWWFDCLTSGRLEGTDFSSAIPDAIPTNRLRDAYAGWARKRNIRGRLKGEVSIGKALRKVAPCLVRHQSPPKKEGDTYSVYKHHGLDQLRQDFERFIGGTIEWPV